MTNETFNVYLEQLSHSYTIFAPLVKKGKGKFAETDVVGYGEVLTLEEIWMEYAGRCIACGRCDDVCPEYISFSKCINKLNQIVEEEIVGE